MFRTVASTIQYLTMRWRTPGVRTGRGAVSAVMTDSFASGHRQHDWLATPRLHPWRVISSRRSLSVPKSAA
jgi:hypothetical protein